MKMLYAIFGVIFLLILLQLIKSHHMFKLLFLTFLEGIASFFAVNLIGGFFNIHIPLNGFSALLAGVGGAPSVIFLLLLEPIFHVL